MAKYYFKDENSETCYTLSSWKDYMRKNKIEELAIYEAEIERGGDHFFCTFHHEPGGVGNGCGNMCSDYLPRNGKSGRCKYSGPVYCRSGIMKTIKMNKKRNNE